MLPARHVIHTVGPVWNGGHQGEDQILATCYRECMRLTAEWKLGTVAFPAISTGAYGFPIERATRIALVEARSGLARHRGLERIVFCCFSDADLAVYDAAAQELFGSSAGEPSTPSPA